MGLMKKIIEITIFDVGAHNGSSIERMRVYEGKKINIFAFEPGLLYESLNEKYGDENTKILNKAVSDKTGKRVFYQHTLSTGSSGLEKVKAGTVCATGRLFLMTTL